MKKTINLGIIFVVLLLLSSPLSAAGKTYKLRFQSIIPSSGMNYLNHFVATVDEYTQGRIKIKVFAADQLVPSPELLNAVAGRVIDIACTIPAMHAPPITTGLMMSGPIFALDSDMEAMAFRESFQGGRAFELMQEEFAENGVHAIGLDYEGGIALLAKKPIRTMADLKGLKAEALVPDIGMFLKSMGVASQFIPPEEIYLALSTGAINASTFGSTAVFYEHGLHEIARYLHKPFWVYGAAPVYIINADIWKGLPKDLQLGLKAAVRAQGIWMGQQLYIKDLEAEQKGNFEVVQFSDELLTYMRKIAVENWDEAAKMSPRSAEIVKLIKEWNRLHGRLK